MLISLIAAASSNRVIGVDDNLPWHLPADLKYFKEKTLGHFMLMGRKTWQSFGKPLPGRTSLVITRDANFLVPDGVFQFSSISKGIEYARKNGESELMIIGGGQIFTDALPFADRIYLTHVYTKFPISPATIFFPPVIATEWEIISSEPKSKDEKHAYNIEFMVLERI